MNKKLESNPDIAISWRCYNNKLKGKLKCNIKCKTKGILDWLIKPPEDHLHKPTIGPNLSNNTPEIALELREWSKINKDLKLEQYSIHGTSRDLLSNRILNLSDRAAKACNRDLEVRRLW